MSICANRTRLAVHHAAVRDLAAKDSLPDVIECWAPIPITEWQLEHVLAIGASEIRPLAQIDGQIVGLAAIIIAKTNRGPVMLRRAQRVEASAPHSYVNSDCAGAWARMARTRRFVDSGTPLRGSRSRASGAR
jgi:hypothetical protein